MIDCGIFDKIVTESESKKISDRLLQGNNNIFTEAVRDIMTYHNGYILSQVYGDDIPEIDNDDFVVVIDVSGYYVAAAHGLKKKTFTEQKSKKEDKPCGDCRQHALAEDLVGAFFVSFTNAVGIVQQCTGIDHTGNKRSDRHQRRHESNCRKGVCSQHVS